MITRYLLTRDIIEKMILACEKTQKKKYWTPFIPEIITMKGSNNDDEYVYDREIFMNKLYFSRLDLKLFMLKKNNQKKIEIDELDYRVKMNNFYTTNYELITLKINDKVPSSDFTLSELIDTYDSIR